MISKIRYNVIGVNLLMKKICLLTLLFLSTIFCFAEKSKNIMITNFHVEGENIVKEQLSKFPISASCDIKGKKNNGITITGEFTASENQQEDLGIILYKNLMSCKVYVNDYYIDTIGRSDKNFFFQPYITRGVVVPRNILHDNNTVRFELWNDTGTYKFRMLEITGKSDYEKRMRTYNFLDVQLPRFASILLLFVTLYCFFMWFNYKSKKEFLYLAMSALMFAGYMLNVTVFDSSMSYIKLKAILYSLFPLASFFLIHYFKRFFELKVKRNVSIVIDLVGIIFTAGYYFFRNTVSLDTWHSLVLSYPFFGMGYGVYGLIKSRKYKGDRTYGIAIGIVIALCFSAYDMYNFMFDITPFILLQGPGFMALIIGTFYSLSQEMSITNAKCVKFAEELKENQTKQVKIISHVKDVSEKISSSGKNLDGSIESVSALMTQYFTNVNQIHTSIKTQYEQVQQNKENVTKIFNAIDKMSELVSQHEKLVETTVSDVNGLTNGINKTDELIKKSSKTINTLTDVCSEADKDVTDSSNLVDDLASYSKNIYAIVNSISEISEQTNVLSINAAIEAARSGDAGKGFSVVAAEIRALASESSKNTNKINDILSTMISKIANIQNQQSLVSSRLKNVISENAKTQNEISDIFSVLKFQLEKSSRISSIIKDLVKTVHDISEQTLEQKNSGENLNNSLTLLTEITNSVLEASKEQMDSNGELKDDVNKIRSVSDENVTITNELKQILE